VHRKLIDYLKSKVSNVAIGYAERAAVAIPFILALGFAVAAVHAMVVERFGSVTGNWSMAAGLVGLGILGAIAVKTPAAPNTAQQEAPNTFSSFSSIPSGFLHAAPAAFHLLSASGQPTLRTARLAWRHAPLLMFAGFLSLLFASTAARWEAPTEPVTGTAEEERPVLSRAQSTLTMRYALRSLLLAEPMF